MASLIEKDTSGIYIAKDGETELVDDRTRSFRKFRNGRSRRVAGQIGHIHYRADPFSDTEQYKEIDLTINLTPGEFWDAAMETNGYQVRFWQSRIIAGKTVRYIAQFRRAGKWLAMAPLALAWENDAGDRELISKPVADITPVIDNDAYTATWANCFGPGIHYRYNVSPDRFFKTVIIDNKADLPTPTISGPGLKLTVVLGISWHSQSKAVNGFAGSITPDVMPNDNNETAIDEEVVDPDVFAYQDENLRDTFWMQKPKAWDSAEERHTIAVDWRLRRRGNRVFAALSVPASVLSSPQVEYPVFVDVDISEEQVGAGFDDGYSYNGSYTNGDDRRLRTSAFMNFNDANSLFSLFRFTTVPIPQGANITFAEFIPWTLSAPLDDPEVTLYCEDIDNSPDLQDPNPLIDNRTLTTASFAWSDTDLGAGFTNPTVGPITSLIQEVVSRGGWLSDNALSVIGDDTQSAKAYQAATYENVPAATAKLNVSYDEVSRGQIIRIQTG